VSDDTRPDPRIDAGGVGRCPEDESCCHYDGKRCDLMGCRPMTICEPWAQWLSRAYLEGREEIRLLSESTYCAYCGEKFPLDNAAAEQVAEHIRTCPKHPMRAAESEVARLREQVAEGERKLGTARALLPIQDGRPVSQGALNALLSQRDTAWYQLDEERATSARLRGLLGEVVASWYKTADTCPVCGQDPCKPACRLAAALEVGHR
jgi:hypothetical protein